MSRATTIGKYDCCVAFADGDEREYRLGAALPKAMTGIVVDPHASCADARGWYGGIGLIVALTEMRVPTGTHRIEVYGCATNGYFTASAEQTLGV